MQLYHLNELYEQLMAQEGVDLTKRTWKEKLAREREAFKKVKRLPGQQVRTSGVEIEIATASSTASIPPPPTAGTRRRR